TEFSTPTSSSGPRNIVVGPDGALWFTEETGNKIGRITTAGVITEYPIPSNNGAFGITLGPDGNLWFTEFAGNKIGRLQASIVLPGSHDFSGDHNSDILWYNTTSGQVVVWLVNGTSVTGGGSPGSVPPPDWAIVGQRDFNGDGFADILWRNGSTGQLLIWLMNGATMIGGGWPCGARDPMRVSRPGDINAGRSTAM